MKKEIMLSTVSAIICICAANLQVNASNTKACGPGLVARFSFDECAGSFSDDPVSKSSAALTPTAKWATGTFGGALATGEKFSGADIFLPPCLDGADAVTYFVRMRRNGNGNGKHPCVISTSGWGDGGILFYAQNDSLSVRLRAGKKGPEASWPVFRKIPEGKWSSAAFVFNRPDVTIYADGRKVASGKWDHPFRTGGQTRLGGWFSDSFNGFIDDFRAWNGALDADTIAELAGDSQYAEIEGYQDDGTGGIRKTEILDQIGRTEAVFEDAFAVLTFDSSGRISSLRERPSGRELVSNVVPFVRATLPDGRKAGVRRMEKLANGNLRFMFAHDAGKVDVAVAPFNGGWRFDVVDSTLPETKEFSFCHVYPSCARWRGSFVNAISDEQSVVCVRSCDLQGEPRCGHELYVTVQNPFGPAGRSAIMSAGPREGFREQLKAMTLAAGAPRSDSGGAWSMESEVARWSYVFAHVRNGDIDYWIDFVKRAGFSNIHNESWASLLGHYPVNKNAFPGGLDEMKSCMEKVHAAGLHAGIHTLTACINPRDPWISPKCREDLVAEATYTLAAPLGEKDKTMLVNEMPIAKHSTVFTYSSNGNVFRIGNELVQYTGIQRDKAPYAFTGIKRGAFGTKKGGTYPAGTKADYLHQRYIAFYPKPDSPLADELADCLANVYNTCNLDEFYFDGSEGMGTRYGIDAMRHRIFKILKPNNGHSPSIEASCMGANNWWFQTRMATVDHGVYAVKRFHDWHIKWAIDNGRHSNFLEPQMGWWQPRVDVPRARGHYVDEMEYFAAKNAGHDAAMSIQGVAFRPLPEGVRRQLTLLGWYEYQLLARAFSPEVKKYLAEPKTEARLRQKDNGKWTVTDSEEFTYRFGFPWSRHWNIESSSARPAALRVEALYAAGRESEGTPMLKASDFPHMTTRAAKDVDVAFKADVKGEHGPAFRLSATNRKAERNAAWAGVKRQFDFPGLNLGKSRIAFGVWVKGDGSGALLSLVIDTPPEYHHGISEHYVRLDFTGWKYVPVLMRDRDVAQRYEHDLKWPYGHQMAFHRTFVDPTHLGSFSAYLNDMPQGSSAAVEIGEVTALDMVPQKLDRATVVLNGEKFEIPFAMAAGDYAELDDGFWTHYTAIGKAIERKESAKGPVLRKGGNSVEFVADQASRATVSFFALSNTRPAFVGELTADMRKTMRFEGMMPFEYAPAKGLLPPAAIPVRPGEKVALSLEIYGPAKNPSFTFKSFFGFKKNVCLFATEIGADERLVCRDGKNWRVEKSASGNLVGEGVLETPLPTLRKSTPLIFAAEVPDNASCTVDILKNYL